MTGQVVHFELPADDVERARKFYADTFGWGVTSVPGMDYTMVGTTPSDEQGMPKEPGAINGGMLERQDPVQHPVITLNVTDMEAACAKLVANGGTVVREKMAVGDMGFAAYFKDTEGNVVGLWQSASG